MISKRHCRIHTRHRVRITSLERKLTCRPIWHLGRIGLQPGLDFFEFPAWIIVDFWTDQLFLDIFALYIATNGTRIGPKFCRTFPWTVVMCVVCPFSIFSSSRDSTRWTLPTGFLSETHPFLDFINFCDMRRTHFGALLQCCLHQNSRQRLAEQGDAPKSPISCEFDL